MILIFLLEFHQATQLFCRSDTLRLPYQCNGVCFIVKLQGVVFYWKRAEYVSYTLFAIAIDKTIVLKTKSLVYWTFHQKLEKRMWRVNFWCFSCPINQFCLPDIDWSDKFALLARHWHNARSDGFYSVHSSVRSQRLRVTLHRQNTQGHIQQ